MLPVSHGCVALAAHIAVSNMVRISCRGTAQCLFENFKKFSRITDFEFQNSGPSFFLCLCLLSIVKNLTRFEQNRWRRQILKFSPMAIPAMALLQQHAAWLHILIEPAACSDRSSGAFRTGGVRNWGRNWAVKTNQLVYVLVTKSTMHRHYKCSLNKAT